MATKVVMEALSPTMEEGRLVKWNKNEGDQVKAGDVLAEVETDKAVMELVARGDGVLRKRLANEGDASPVGTLLAVIANADENIDSIVGGAGAPAAASSAPAQPAQAQQASQAAAPNKTVADTKEAAGKSPVPQTPAQSQGEASTPPQQKSAGTRPASPPPPPASRPAPPRPPSAPSPPRGNGASKAPADGRSRSSPLARRLATERGIQLGSIQGSGPGGRIVKRDIENARATASAGVAAGRSAAAERLAKEGDYKDVPLTQIRKTIARRLSESNGPIPTFFLTAELDAA